MDPVGHVLLLGCSSDAECAVSCATVDFMKSFQQIEFNLSKDREPVSHIGTLVYVVDDEPLIVEFVKAVLEENGFRVQAFSDPLHTVVALNSEGEKPTLLITDFVMNPTNGGELIQRALDIIPDLKTILMSGNLKGKPRACIDFSPDSFLNKPFGPDELIDCVTRLLEGTPKV